MLRFQGMGTEGDSTSRDRFSYDKSRRLGNNTVLPRTSPDAAAPVRIARVHPLPVYLLRIH